MNQTLTQKKCLEKVFTEDLGDGYSGYETCGGNIEKIGSTNLYQCNSCKKVTEISK